MRGNVLTSFVGAPRRFLLTKGAAAFFFKRDRKVRPKQTGRLRIESAWSICVDDFSSELPKRGPYLPRHRTKSIRRAAMYHIPNRYYGAPAQTRTRSRRPNTRGRFVTMEARVTVIRAPPCVKRKRRGAPTKEVSTFRLRIGLRLGGSY